MPANTAAQRMYVDRWIARWMNRQTETCVCACMLTWIQKCVQACMHAWIGCTHMFAERTHAHMLLGTGIFIGTFRAVTVLNRDFLLLLASAASAAAAATTAAVACRHFDHDTMAMTAMARSAGSLRKNKNVISPAVSATTVSTTMATVETNFRTRTVSGIAL